MTNAEKYPKVWKLFVKNARNLDGLYQIHNPDKSGSIICADTPGGAF